MLTDVDFTKLKKSYETGRDSIVVKRAKMEETKQQIEILGKELVRSGIIDSSELDEEHVLAKIDELESQLMREYDRIKEIL